MTSLSDAVQPPSFVPAQPAVTAKAREYPETRFRVRLVERVHEVRFQMAVGPWMLGPDGAQTVASLGVLIDATVGMEVYRTRPAGTHSVTGEVSFDVVTPPPWSGPALTARAGTLSRDPDGGLSRCEIVDGAGRPVAVAVGRCRFVPAAGIPSAEELGPPLPPADHRTLLEVLGLSDLSPAPAGPGQVGTRTARLVVPASPAFINGGGTVHGGVLLTCSELATHLLADPDRPEQTTSVRLNFLRPGALAHPVTYTAEVFHRGRSISVYRVTSSGPSGRPYTTATITRTRGTQPR